jgi:hypothetical protein
MYDMINDLHTWEDADKNKTTNNIKNGIREVFSFLDEEVFPKLEDYESGAQQYDLAIE